ncbi:MAG: PIN domain-containing protein [Pseudomonadota bacterium]
MRVLIDANVLYPTVLREIVLGVASRGVFTPLWSARILEEWRRAAARQGQGAVAEAEIAGANAAFPTATVAVSPATEARLSLPDPDDIHVLAAAVDGDADELLTMNLRDFPTNALAAKGVIRRDPDGFLLEQFHADGAIVRDVAQGVLRRAGDHGIDVRNPRSVLKKARLPRLGKALFG